MLFDNLFRTSLRTDTRLIPVWVAAFCAADWDFQGFRDPDVAAAFAGTLENFAGNGDWLDAHTVALSETAIQLTSSTP
jgi:hypothetical protein